MNFRYKWTQQYNQDSRWQRLYYANKLIQIHNDLMRLDQLEPILDLTQASEYLNQFRLTGENDV